MNYHSEVSRLKKEVKRLKSTLNIRGDDLCVHEDLAAAKALPKDQFLQSCERFYNQISSERGVVTGCMTIAQLEQENQKLADQLQSESHRLEDEKRENIALRERLRLLQNRSSLEV